MVYGFDVLREINEQAGQVDGSPKQPVGIVHGGVVPKGVHPRDYLKLLELPEDEEVQP